MRINSVRYDHSASTTTTPPTHTQTHTTVPPPYPPPFNTPPPHPPPLANFMHFDATAAGRGEATHCLRKGRVVCAAIRCSNPLSEERSWCVRISYCYYVCLVIADISYPYG